MLELKNISKTYRSKNGVTCRALNNVSLSFEETGLVFIVGKSGGGKSTLLNIIGALDRADRGAMLLYGNDFTSFSNAQLDAYRNTYVGTVFQEYNLLPTLNAKSNVSLALGMQGKRSREAVDGIFEKMGLSELQKRKSNQLSGGQSQRIAIARALVKDPRIILADEPTGNLDSKTGQETFEIFKALSKEKLVIVVTHDRETADRIGDRVIEIKDGRVYKDIVRTDQAYERRVDLVGDKLIRVPKKAAVDERALHDINELLSVNDKDTYIINERDIQKVKSLNIHVKNSVDLDVDEDASNYYPYTPKPTEKKKIKLIKGRMPFWVGLKLSLSTFRYKTFRLIVTVVMLTLALVIAAALASFAAYDSSRAMAQTILADDIVNLYVQKNVDYAADAAFTDEELAMAFGGNKGIPVYAAELVITPVGNDVKPTEETIMKSLIRNFTGMAEVTDAADMGLRMLYGTGALADFDSVVISQLVAYDIARMGYFTDVTKDTLENIVGKQLSLNGVTLSICGVYESDFSCVPLVEEYIDMGWYTPEQMWYIDEGTYFLTERNCVSGIALVAPGFSDYVVESQKALSATLQCLYDSARTVSRITVADISSIGSKRLLTVNRGITENYVYIDLTTYNEMFGAGLDLSNERYYRYYDKSIKKTINAFNARVDNIYSLNYPTDSETETNRSAMYPNLKIKGVYMYGKTNVAGVIYVADDVYTNYADGWFTNGAIIVRTRDTVDENIALLNDLSKAGYVVRTYAGEQYGGFVSSLKSLQNVLLAVLAVTIIVAGILLFSFVSASIKLEKRQIGILRAMGARGIDTFKTFAIEGTIISLFSMALAYAACWLLFPIANAELSSGLLYSAFFFIISPTAAVYMLCTAAVITALGIIIPLIRLIRMSPVDAINKNDNQR